jgi:hypothetical protein
VTAPGTGIRFTFLWTQNNCWEGKGYVVTVNLEDDRGRIGSITAENHTSISHLGNSVLSV